MRFGYIIIGVILLFFNPAYAQSPPGDYSFLFYNVENLFDVSDDPTTNDDEFTPDGSRYWSQYRFRKKILNISKVILNAAGWVPPQLIALCEVENRYVLEQLLNYTPLSKFPYKIIHKESPDPRGIDVAFIYNADIFYPINYSFFPLINSNDSVQQSREILYVSGILNQADTLHIFVNHWPSRYSGQLETIHGRKLAAQTLKRAVGKVMEKHKRPKVIIAGDFNDQPADESIHIFSEVYKSKGRLSDNTIYNLSHPWMNAEIKTIKHQSQWFVFDQVLVSGALLDDKNDLYTLPEMAKIVNLPFLLEKDEKYGGHRLNRTYNGFSYHGGFSDHLPVLLKLKSNP